MIQRLLSLSMSMTSHWGYQGLKKTIYRSKRELFLIRMVSLWSTRRPARR
nr:MAG TPA: hypothetical protein [Caudoviricetes sp.]